MKNQVQSSEVSPHELHHDPKVLRVDVRTPMEFEAKHLPDAVLHPVHELDIDRLREAAGDRPVCFICASGGRARQAAAKASARGMRQVVVLDGGVDAWESAELPLVRGRKGISLERQVRIAAGSLVLAGVIGAVALHPAFVLLAGFVGAGLVFAGLTDWCGMGMLLARMPWNNQRPSCCERS